MCRCSHSCVVVHVAVDLNFESSKRLCDVMCDVLCDVVLVVVVDLKFESSKRTVCFDVVQRCLRPELINCSSCSSCRSQTFLAEVGKLVSEADGF